MAVSRDRVLVTGGAGFIGVNLAPVLAEAGYVTRCYDDFSTGRRDDAVRAAYDEIVEGDVLDLDSLTEAARGCAHVVHLAAQAGVPASVKAPLVDCDLNVRGTLHTLLAARDAGVGGFVFASSNAPLGEIIPPAHEDPVPAFVALKAMAHQLKLPEVSMGMSADYEKAVACGATQIRLGTALFGARA